MVFSIELNAQTNYSLSEQIKLNPCISKFNRSVDSSFNNRVFGGAGMRLSFHTNPYDGDYKLTLSSGIIFHLGKRVYLNTAIDIYKAQTNSLGMNLNIIPSFQFNSKKNRFNFMMGGGGIAQMAFGTKGGILLGFVLLLKPEYKVSERNFIAIELKHNNFPGEGSEGVIIMMNVLFTHYY